MSKTSEPIGATLEERKFEQDAASKQRELDLKEREIAAREREVAAKEVELRRSRWLNPTVIGLFAAALGLIGSVLVARVNNSNTQEVERLRSESNVTLDAIKTGTGNTDAACKNLTFLVSLGLVRDPEGKIAKQCKDAPKGPPSLPASVAAPTTVPSAARPATGISPDWPKPDPVDEVFEGSEGTCPGTGDGGDTATNARKNRTDPLPVAHDIAWANVASLPYPLAPLSRANWTADQLAAIQPFEGVAVRTTGFLTHKTNVESSGSGESTNCHFHADDEVDWLIYLQQKPTDTIATAVIVEATPRVRKLHHWDPTVLDQWVMSSKPIRVTGFLMLDPEHQNQVGKYRGTVWEIHPITNIEVCNAKSCGDRDWVTLDQVSQPGAQR